MKNKTFTAVEITLGVVEAINEQQAHKKLINEGMNVGCSDEQVFAENENLQFWGNLTIEHVQILLRENQLRKETMYKVTWFDNGGASNTWGYFTQSAFKKNLKETNIGRDKKEKLKSKDFHFEQLMLQY